MRYIFTAEPVKMWALDTFPVFKIWVLDYNAGLAWNPLPCKSNHGVEWDPSDPLP